jgi:hypothetical protein
VGGEGTAGAGELWPRAGGTSHRNKARDTITAQVLCVSTDSTLTAPACRNRCSPYNRNPREAQTSLTGAVKERKREATTKATALARMWNPRGRKGEGAGGRGGGEGRREGRGGAGGGEGRGGEGRGGERGGGEDPGLGSPRPPAGGLLSKRGSERRGMASVPHHRASATPAHDSPGVFAVEDKGQALEKADSAVLV